MQNTIRTIALALLVTFGAVGCGEGALEDAGEEVDDAAEDATD